MILVVGATGQVGAESVRQAHALGMPVRALVRAPGPYPWPDAVETARGDLRDEASLGAACRGVDAVIATASATVPRRGDSFTNIEGRGYDNLIAACRRSGVGQIVFLSGAFPAAAVPYIRRAPVYRTKLDIEERLRAGGVPYTIVRAGPFMEVYLAALGSRRTMGDGAEATLRRPFWFVRGYMAAVGNLIDRHGIALVPGSGVTRHAFIAVEDVARFLVRAVGHPAAMNAVFDVGGPESLSWEEVVATYARVMHRRVRAVHQPAPAYRVLSRLFAWSPSAANSMTMGHWLASCDTGFDSSEAARTFGVAPRTVETFLRERFAG